MTDWWTKPARKAIESHILPILAAAEIYVRLPGIALPQQVPTEYVRFSFHAAPVQVRTMGRNGRIEGRGFAKFGIFTRLGGSQDRNDTIAGIVALAFPYTLDLIRDGIRVDIDTTDHTQFVEIDGWGYSPVDVNWTVWSIQ